MGFKFDPADFGDTFHQFGDFRRNDLGDILKADVSIFNNVMQNATGHGYNIHVHFRQDYGCLIGMFKIGLTGFALLTAMGFPGIFVGFPEKFFLFPGNG